jgi:hypothetical protein
MTDEPLCFWCGKPMPEGMMGLCCLTCYPLKEAAYAESRALGENTYEAVMTRAFKKCNPDKEL